MEDNENWDEEEFRTKFESEEHWALKRDFINAHKGKFPKQRLVCLAQVFVNIQLLRCKYPDTVMRQVAELAKGIGKDYKTKQKERLQRTFVKASDAASAKVRGVKRKQPEVPQSNSSKKISFVKETSTESSTNIEVERSMHMPFTDASKVNFGREMSTTKTDLPNVMMKTSSVHSNKYAMALKKEVPSEKMSVHSPKITALISGVTNIKLPENFSNLNTEKNATSMPVNFSGLNSEKVMTPETSEQFITKLSEKSDPSLKMNSEDPSISNLFLVHRSFLNFTNFYFFLRCSAEFFHYKLSENIQIEKQSGKSICTLQLQVNGNTLTLGSGQDLNQKVSREEAAKEAVKNLLQKCHTLEIKTQVAGKEEVSLGNLIGLPDKEEKISNDNVGAKMLKLMGWSGGALGKTGEGIIEPVKASNIVGRQGLGISSEQRPTPNFQKKVRDVLDGMINSMRQANGGVVPDLIFSSELSSEQRKHIHLFIQKKYRQLKSTSYGKAEDRFLVVRPKLNNAQLVHKVSSQGGLTDQYEIHKPGTLSLQDISKKISLN